MFNRNMRKKAMNDSEKDFYKLMNNAVFGKTMENVRNHMDIKLVNGDNTKKIIKLVSNPLYEKSIIYNDNLIGIHMKKKVTLLYKPIYCGMAILDLSKVLMYNYYYKNLIPKYGCENIKLVMTDTDSLLLYIKTNDVYKDMLLDYNNYDFSEYTIERLEQIYSSLTEEEKQQIKIPLKEIQSINKKVIGKFKDETSDTYIPEAVALRSKQYAITTDNDKEKKKLKGIKKNVVEREIGFKDYKRMILNNSNAIKKTMNTIRSINHEIYTISQNKVALCSYDDKKLYIRQWD